MSRIVTVTADGFSRSHSIRFRRKLRQNHEPVEPEPMLALRGLGDDFFPGLPCRYKGFEISSPSGCVEFSSELHVTNDLANNLGRFEGAFLGATASV